MCLNWEKMEGVGDFTSSIRTILPAESGDHLVIVRPHLKGVVVKATVAWSMAELVGLRTAKVSV